MKQMILWALMAVAPAMAQEKITKLITLKYAEPRAVESMLQMFGVAINSNNQMRTMAILGTPEKIAAVEAAIKQLDVAPKSVELTVYFLVGGDQPGLMGNGTVPQELRDVITQLKGTFTFKEYKMLDALTLRTRVGSSAETSGILNAGTPPRMSQFSIRNTSLSEDGTTIRIDRMHAGLRIPYTRRSSAVEAAKGAPAQSSVEYINSGIDQDVDVKQGQKVVVGRSSLEGPQQALFLILTANVIQ